MSTKTEIVVCRASYCKVFLAIFRRVSFSTATSHRWDEKVDPRSRMALSYQ